MVRATESSYRSLFAPDFDHPLSLSLSVVVHSVYVLFPCLACTSAFSSVKSVDAAYGMARTSLYRGPGAQRARARAGQRRPRRLSTVTIPRDPQHTANLLSCIFACWS